MTVQACTDEEPSPYSVEIDPGGRPSGSALRPEGREPRVSAIRQPKCGPDTPFPSTFPAVTALSEKGRRTDVRDSAPAQDLEPNEKRVSYAEPLEEIVPAKNMEDLPEEDGHPELRLHENSGGNRMETETPAHADTYGQDETSSDHGYGKRIDTPMSYDRNPPNGLEELSLDRDGECSATDAKEAGTIGIIGGKMPRENERGRYYQPKNEPQNPLNPPERSVEQESHENGTATLNFPREMIMAAQKRDAWIQMTNG
ncbi:hypothetical protein GE061_003171 [Apolygus lucorum]|uniref:Uncharacterized protein n=1 Tax=Apolygus lucorum TaxID=248454 RepID=A0A8S9X2S4_APOLU|nr:hypothetical protein GE061_003171 [Apolygus lucorum]